MCGATKTTVSAALAFILAKREEIAKNRLTVDEIISTTGVLIRKMAEGKPELLALADATEELQYAKLDLDAVIFGALGYIVDGADEYTTAYELESAVEAYNAAKEAHATAEEAAGPALEALRREQAFAGLQRGDADGLLN